MKIKINVVSAESLECDNLDEVTMCIMFDLCRPDMHNILAFLKTLTDNESFFSIKTRWLNEITVDTEQEDIICMIDALNRFPKSKLKKFKKAIIDFISLYKGNYELNEMCDIRNCADVFESIKEYYTIE